MRTLTRLAKQGLLLCGLALAFGFAGAVAAVADAVWNRLPSGVAERDYVSLGRRASLSKRVEGMADASVAEIRQKVPEAQWLTVQRLDLPAVEVHLDGATATMRLGTEGVPGHFFDALGVIAANGVLSVGESAAAVLGHATWQQALDGADVAGVSLAIPNEGELAIVGVAPRGFRGLIGEQSELWILNPQRLPSNIAKDDFGKRIDAAVPDKYVFGILGEGMSLAKLDVLLADMSFVADEMSGGAVGVSAEDRLETTPGLEAHPDTRREVQSRIRWLVAVVACLLVLSFVALVDVLLAARNARELELRVRVAVGATPGRLYAYCLAENAAFAAATALVAGAAGAYLGKVLLTVQPFAVWLVEVPPASIVVGYAAGAVGLMLAFILAAGFAVSRVSRASRSSSVAWRTGTATRRLQILAATASLLVVASVTTRYWTESALAFGFANESVLMVQAWSAQGAPTTEAMRDTVEAHPQVRSAARLDLLPFFQPLSRKNRVQIVGEAHLEGVPLAYGEVQPDYFETLDVPVLAGRIFRGPSEVVLSRSMAKALVGAGTDESQAVGRAIRLRSGSSASLLVVQGQVQPTTPAEPGRVATIVGVVADIAYGHYLDGERMVVYGDGEGDPWDQRWAIDHVGEASTLVRALRQARAFEGFELVEIGTPRSLFRIQFMARRNVEILLAGAAALALVLAFAGLASSQARRLTADRGAIGIGLAVGATECRLTLHYLDGWAVDFGLAAVLPCMMLLVFGVVFPVALSGLVDILATQLVVPVLLLVAGLCVAIVYLAVRHRARTSSPAALMCAV